MHKSGHSWGGKRREKVTKIAISVCLDEDNIKWLFKFSNHSKVVNTALTEYRKKMESQSVS